MVQGRNQVIRLHAQRMDEYGPPDPNKPGRASIGGRNGNNSRINPSFSDPLKIFDMMAIGQPLRSPHPVSPVSM
jgi:hypothetical protein